LSDQFNSMAGAAGNLCRPRIQGRGADPDLAQSINELKVLEKSPRGRLLARPQRRAADAAARALEITHADAVLIYGYDAQSISSTSPRRSASTRRPKAGISSSARTTALGEAATSGEPIAIPHLGNMSEHPLRDVAIEAGFHSVLVVPLVDQTGILGSLVVLRRNAGEFSQNLIGLMKTFAHQSVLAMRNARLFTEVDAKGRELETAHTTVQQQAAKLQEQTEQLKNWNKSLEERVEKQLGEIERIRRLERFLRRRWRS
jgi:GAF domain-containing protein